MVAVVEEEGAVLGQGEALEAFSLGACQNYDQLELEVSRTHYI